MVGHLITTFHRRILHLSFQVSATALEETKVLVWHRDKLKLTLMESPYLYTVFEHIIARDVVRKLAQVLIN